MTTWRDKVVLITGGSAGFGLALAKAFTQAEARVVVAARDRQRLEAAVAALRESGGQAWGITADVTREEDVQRLVQETLNTCDRIDMLVNNVGRSTRGEVATTPATEFASLLELNFLTAVRCSQAALPALRETRGHLVYISSLAARAATRYLGAYPASKAALALFAQQLRLELASQGIHVLLVCPGPIARSDAGRRYDAMVPELPEAARQPGAGVRIRGTDPDKLAQKVLRACRRRQAELIVPAKAKLLFAISAFSPALGDAVLKRVTR